MKKTVLVLTAIALAFGRAEAHKPITSKYTYTEDVYPIVSQRCGGCHAPGGIAPMSLMTYDDARPWAEAIRIELASGHMPPWFADPAFIELKDQHKLQPRELDVLLTWVTGGTPRGADTATPAATVKSAWRKGRPDLVFAIPAEFTLPGDKAEETREFLLQSANDQDRWIAAADLRPGNPTVVHDALIYTKRADGTQTVLAAWVPGADPVALGNGLGFRWRAGEKLAVRIHYRKTWKYEGKPATDRSTVGLYLGKAAASGAVREVRGLMVPPSGLVLDQDVQALAIRTADAPSDVDLRVEAALPGGVRIPVAAVTTRAGWDRRYWFARPFSLPRGATLNLKSAPADTSTKGPPRLWIDVAPSR